MISLYCWNPRAVALDEYWKINDYIISAGLQHKATMLSWAPQTPVWLGIKDFSTNWKASSAVSRKQAISPKLKEYLAAEYRCPGWAFRLKVSYGQKTVTEDCNYRQWLL